MASVLLMGPPFLSATSHHAQRAYVPVPISHNSITRGSLLRAAASDAPATLDPPPTLTKSPPVRKNRKPDTAVLAPSRPFTHSSAPPSPPQQEQVVLGENLAAASKVSLMKWKVVDLKAMLGELQQPKSGNKEALVERLLETIQQITEEDGKLARKPARKPRKLSKADAGTADDETHSHAQSTLCPAPALSEDSSSSSSSSSRGKGGRKKKMSTESMEGMLQQAPSSRDDEGGVGEGAAGEMRSIGRSAAPGADPQKLGDSASGAGLIQHSRRPVAAQGGAGAPSLPQQPSSSSSSSSSKKREGISMGVTATGAPEKEFAVGKESVQPPKLPRGPTTISSEPPQPLSTSKREIVEGVEVPLADDSILPPMPVNPHGKNYGLHESDLPPSQLKGIVDANPTDMQLAFLGTAAFRPHRGRALGSVALLRGKDVWIFDSGDDLQRQLGSLPAVRPSKVFRVFITCITPDCLLGLPGLMCTISAARMRGHSSADIPVHIYGPRGIAEFLCTVFKVSNTYNEISMVVYEFVPHAVEEDERHPTLFNKRARVFRALVPPDALNPQGITNGNLDSFMPTYGRAEIRKGNFSSAGPLGYDPRAGFLPFPPAVPGDPSRSREVLPLESMTWTVQADISARFTVVALPNSAHAQREGSGQEEHLVLACILQEADRLGSLRVDRAEALGVPGDDFTNLKAGKTVLNKHGQAVTSDMCVTAPKIGRKVAIMGSGSAVPAPSSAFAEHAKGADVLVSGAVAPPSRGSMPSNQEPTSHGTMPSLSAAAFGKLAAQLGVDRLMLARLDMRQLQQVLQQGAPTHQLAPIRQPDPSTEEKPAGWECKEHADEVQGVEWSNQALEAAESIYVKQLQQEALESVAENDASCDVSVPFDFWLHVLEKHG